MAVGVRHQLIGLFGGGVEADRMVAGLAFAKGQAAVAAIDTAARGIDQMLDGLLTTAFEHMAKADHIALQVHSGILQRVPHTGLSREVQHLSRLLHGKQLGHRGCVRQVGSHKLKRSGDCRLRAPRGTFKTSKPGLFECRIVIRIEVVKTDDPLASLNQDPGDGSPDEPGNTCHQDRSRLSGLCAVRQSGCPSVWNGFGGH